MHQNKQNGQQSGEQRPQTKTSPNDKIGDKTMHILLDNAPLKLGYFGQKPQLLHSSTHMKYIRKKTNEEPNFFRPDTLHQVILTGSTPNAKDLAGNCREPPLQNGQADSLDPKL